MNENTTSCRRRVAGRHYNLSNDNSNTADDSFSVCSTRQKQQHRLGNTRKKPGKLICSICDGPAHGYNFDTITCESCKAFFRRNALKPSKKFKCRSDNGPCVITITTRKGCKACRLDKCFERGMRADWILTDEERINKKQKIEDNRRLRQLLYPDSPGTDEVLFIQTKNEPDILFSPSLISLTLSSEDLIKIAHIQQSFIDSVRLTTLPPEIPSYPHTARVNAPSEIVNLPTNIQSTRLITFFKLTPEFSSLKEHDKIVLIKHNTFTLVFIRSAINYNSLTDGYQERGTDECVFAGKDIIQCFSLHQYEQTTRCIHQLVDASQNDRVLLEILLIIMLLSKDSSICTYTVQAEPILNDILSIYRAQNIFIELLSKYCENKFGFTKTVDIWLKLTMGSINAHLQSYNTRHNYVNNDLVADQLVPLMKSVMLTV